MILAEDRQHEVFLRRFLTALGGFERRQFTAEIGPRGRGAGEQFVRERYPQALNTYRRRSSHLALVLAVLVDADVLTVDERHQRLSAELASMGIDPRQPGEAVAILIPRRNIETWIAYLKDRTVDETTDYKPISRPPERECLPAVKRLQEYYQSGWVLPDDCPDSLRRAVEELKRIL